MTSTQSSDQTPVTATAGESRRWWSLAVLALSLAMIVLDGTIVGVATPAIVAALQLQLTDAQWISALYSMVFAALLLPVGRLADRIGRRTMLAWGIGIFTLASGIAGQADGIAALLWARTLQGIGGAMILPTTLSTVNATFTGKDRLRAFGVWGAVMSGAAALGPLLGGWLTTAFEWRWIFYVNIPVGIVLLAAVLVVVPQTLGEPGHGWDLGGLLTSVLGLALVVFGLIEGRTLGWWRPNADFKIGAFTWSQSMPVALTPVVLLVGLLAMLAFIRIELRRSKADRELLLDPKLFSIPTFTWGNIAAATVAAGEFSLVFVLPLHLVNALSFDVMTAGYVLSAMALGAFFAGASARHLAARWSAADVVVLGLGLELAGLIVMALIILRTESALVVALPLVVYGLGLGLASAQLTSTVLRDVPTARSGTASATQSTVRQVGSALGTAIAGTVLAVGMAFYLPRQLATVARLDPVLATKLVASTIDSAGGLIPALHGAAGRMLGDPALVDPVSTALSRGFAQATTLSVSASAALILLGLIASLRVRAVARAQDPATDNSAISAGTSSVGA